MALVSASVIGDSYTVLGLTLYQQMISKAVGQITALSAEGATLKAQMKPSRISSVTANPT
jgi:hypothetical protein